MKSATTIAIASILLGGCTLNGGTPVTAWGKKDVSMLDYRTDAGECAVLAVTTQAVDNAAKSAGGINGANAGLPESPQARPAAAVGAPLLSGSIYRDSAPADFVNRAAMQQRTQEINAQRLRTDTLRSCLTDRGYQEFVLSDAQRSALSKLPQGSAARRAYLYALGTDPEVLAKQALPHD